MAPGLSANVDAAMPVKSASIPIFTVVAVTPGALAPEFVPLGALVAVEPAGDVAPVAVPFLADDEQPPAIAVMLTATVILAIQRKRFWDFIFWFQPLSQRTQLGLTPLTRHVTAEG
jgi:hypothetical protein